MTNSQGIRPGNVSLLKNRQKKKQNLRRFCLYLKHNKAVFRHNLHIFPSLADGETGDGEYWF